MERIAYDEFLSVFRSSKRAWHLELRDTYNVESEDEPFARFLSGESDSYDWLDEWLRVIREATVNGIAVERLRVVTVPHSDYTRWGLLIASYNVQVGEDIRYLPRDAASGVEFPVEDCWLFDDNRLILSVFSEDGRTGGFARVVDSDLVAEYRLIRDQVWPLAIPYAQYISRPS